MRQRYLLLMIWVAVHIGSAPASAISAGLDPARFKGSENALAYHEFPSGEVCIIPRTFPKLGTGKPDPAQTALCAIDFYDDPSIGICPKGNSTNPGVDVYQVKEGSTKATFESVGCKQPEKKRPGKKLAKFKQTITCSDTSSILAYYEVSQVLGGAGEVPAAVIRTMNDETHKKITQAGLGTAIRSSWIMYEKAESSPGAHPELFTQDGRYVYGAFVKNPSGDSVYGAIIGNRSDYEHGEDAFLATSLFKAISSPNPITVPNSLVGAAKELLALKDTSDMILIDTLLNQQDRFGNEAKRSKYIWIEGGKLTFAKAEGADANEMTQKGAVLVDTLLLKDNDCGVSKRNWFAKPKVRLTSAYPHGILPAVRHMSANTYHKFMALAGVVEQDPDGTGDYFRTDLLLTPTSWKSVAGNIATARKILQDNCAAGKLQLDLDLEPRLGLETAFTNACD
jgi:hypothetical protein